MEQRPQSMTEDQIRSATVGELRVHAGPIYLADYDPAWPQLFAGEARRITEALGDRALRIEHVGSTSVPGLAAKPVIDILLVVADSGDEQVYVPALEAAGYVLQIREPDWYEHRMFVDPNATDRVRDIHVHVFSEGCPEIERMLAFRDRLRTNRADRELYERRKRALARQEWRYVQNYADAKGAVVEEIIARAHDETGG
jgi:GrpB-like predicted nucleotidyltransferase (UPF0157 family)